MDFIDHKKPFHNHYKRGNGQINVHQKQRNHHFENGHSLKDIEGTKQSNEVPKNEDSLDNKTANRHNDHISDYVTQGTGDAEGKVNDGNRDVMHSDKEGSVKNSDNRDQMSQSSHTTNGKILHLFFLLKLYIGKCLLFDNFFCYLFLMVCYI
jgi:hypothetical protein